MLVMRSTQGSCKWGGGASALLLSVAGCCWGWCCMTAATAVSSYLFCTFLRLFLPGQRGSVDHWSHDHRHHRHRYTTGMATREPKRRERRLTRASLWKPGSGGGVLLGRAACSRLVRARRSKCRHQVDDALNFAPPRKEVAPVREWVDS